MKQIYASLEFSENEIRLLVGEYFNIRFNVIKLERVPCEGLTNCRITDHDKVKEALQRVLENTSKMLGAKVEQVILLIPSINMKRYPLKVTLPTKHGYLSKEDIAYALSQTMKTPVDDDVTIINASIIRYIVNGISYRRLPEKEVCDEFAVDIDLLCADKKIAFEYAMLLDECELKIMDVCLDSYAIGKEAALFERTLNRNLILLNI
ncbi:MAG: cell division protein FtsA, partial [Erysipelotrichaceae bacterium]|nr:cell division protein FtsA [Erysipelotrichaceae bacterium]